MQQFRRWFTPQLLILAFGISLIRALVSVFVLPHLYFAGIEAHTQHSAILLWTGVSLVALMLVIVLMALFFKAASELDQRSEAVLGKTVLRLVVLALLFGLTAILIGVIYGLLAVLINALLKNSLSFDQIKGVINVITTVISLIIAPLLINILLTCALRPQAFWTDIIQGLKITRDRYLKFMLLALASVAAGWLVAITFSFIQTSMPLQVVQAVIYSIIGMIVLVAALSLFDDAHISASEVQSSKAIVS